ncbi:MAG: hypothetical protein WCI43_04255 [Candidatus Firestonebacteria bacterium]
MKNTWSAKAYRTLTCLLPPAKNRAGKCIQCGKCCSLPNKCPFLKVKADGSAHCVIHVIRPLNCRKYPRTKKEHITPETCGYTFKENDYTD